MPVYPNGQTVRQLFPDKKNPLAQLVHVLNELQKAQGDWHDKQE
jgi:hypothetical protein